MSRKRSLTEDEHTLWETVTRSVAPLKRRTVRPPAPGNAVPAAAAGAPERPSRGAAKAAAPAAPPVKTAPPLAPLGRRLKQRLGRGSEPVDARIDLHGMTQADAHVALTRFLMRAQRDGARVVLVITGKGVRGGGDPHVERGVLKRQVPLWLEGAELRALVIGFESASIGHGGAGALYVRVRRGG
jgi:DNA-nicking Smr family endonuclease